MANYEKMSVEQLEAVLTELEGQHVQIKAEKRAAGGVLGRKMIEAEAARKVAAMSDAERQALAQAIGAQAIASEEGVGVPGAG